MCQGVLHSVGRRQGTRRTNPERLATNHAKGFNQPALTLSFRLCFLRACFVLAVLVVSPLGRAGTQNAFESFNAWTGQYFASDPAHRATLLAQGIQLATERRAVLRQLIQDNPSEAIAQTVPARVRAGLPPEIIAILEERVSGTGDIRVIARGSGAKRGVSGDRLARTVRIGLRTLPAHVYGWRLVDQDFADVPLHGIIVDGEAALAESPVRVLDSAESPAGKEATGRVAANVGGAVKLFDTAASLAEHERRLMYPLGMKVPGPRDREALSKLPRIARVRPNELAWRRINARRAREGARRLSREELGVVPMGADLEIVNPAGTAVAAPASMASGSTDNSTSNYFPPIRSQGSLGSCAAFSTTYYQMTYMTAMARGWDAKNGGDSYRFSPKWTYNMINGGNDSGSQEYDSLNVGRDHGCATWAEFPYDTNYRAWCLTSNVWRQAISRRMNSYYTIPSVYTDAGLANLKAVLDNGYVVTFDTYAPWSYRGWVQGVVGNDPSTSLDDAYVGQKICTYVRALDWGHAMTIVGYNDNIWCDLNGNGVVDAGEKGALKIANSWGTRFGNSGFAWFAYDALKTDSAVDGWNPSDKVYGFGYGDYSGYCQVYVTTAKASYSPQMIAQFTVSHALRNQMTMIMGKGLTSATSNPTTTWTPVGLSGDGGAYAFDGTTTACDGTFFLDMTGVAPDATALKRYFVGMKDTTNDATSGWLKSVVVMDLTSGNNYSITPAANPGSFNPSAGSSNGTTAWGFADIFYGQAGADLAVTLSGSPSTVTAGDSLNYFFTVTNAGPNAASGVQLVDSLPAGIVPVFFIPSQGTVTYTGGTVAVNLGTIESGNTATFRIGANATVSGTLINSCSLSSSSVDPVQANNSAQVTTVVPFDADGDGMSDVWELANGLNPHDPSDAAADADGDGFTNLQEYLLGTNPCCATSKLCITDIQLSGNDLSLTFASVPGKSYVVEYKDGITSALWSLEATVSASGTATQVTASNVLQRSKRVYRVRLSP